MRYLPACLLLIAADISAGNSSTIELVKGEAGSWRLEARRAELPQVVAEIAVRTGLQIHYSVLPDSKVDATCVGDAPALLQCLLGGSINMAYRKSASSPAGEAWIMGSSLSSVPVCSVRPGSNVDPVVSGDRQTAGHWLKLIRGKDAAQRAIAAAELADVDPAHDREADAALRKALKDVDPQVRREALGALVKRDGETAVTEPLRQALNDANAEVRMAAVDRIDSDVTLLQLAAQDGDANVRGFALVKLEQLNNP